MGKLLNPIRFKRSAYFFGILSLAFVLNACETYVTPKKVERKVVKNKWLITSFYFNGENIKDQFSQKYLVFSESGTVMFTPTVNESASWTTGTSKKPTLLYINGFVTAPYFYLNDDWTVVNCSNSSIQLESTIGNVTNSITLLNID